MIYFRAGYDAAEYSPDGISARLTLERSRAIKVPTILSHLSTFKKVQQALSQPGQLHRFLSPDRAALIQSTFHPLYPLDGAAPLGQWAQGLALDPSRAVDHVLKPSLEGGGHNVYGPAISGFLASIKRERWADFVLMERIRPPTSEICNILLSGREIYQGPVVSELGVFGSVLWRSNTVAGHPEHGGSRPDATDGVEMLANENAGWSFKTKAVDVDEMSVIKGFGCFDCPFLD